MDMIDVVTLEHDVIIDRGKIRKRKKKPSKKFRDDFEHTPLSIEEEIPWSCRRLVIGTGRYGRLPVMEEVRREAKQREVEQVVLPTAQVSRRLEKTLKLPTQFSTWRAEKGLLQHSSVPFPGIDVPREPAYVGGQSQH